MATRWAVERAVLAADLSAVDKLVLLVLLVHSDARTLDTGKFSPSLTVLARETQLDRSTVRRSLARLEAGSWLTRHRPPVELARSRKARTRYVLADPSGGTVPPESGGLGAQGPQGGGSGPPELGAQDTSTRGSGPLRSDRDLDQISSQVIERVITVLEDLGVRSVTREHAARVARQIGPGRSNTAAYVERVIRSRPADFRPTPQPPRFTAAKGFGS